MRGGRHTKRFPLHRAAARHRAFGRVGQGGTAVPCPKHVGQCSRSLRLLSVLGKRMGERAHCIERVARAIALYLAANGKGARPKRRIFRPAFFRIIFESKKLEGVGMRDALFAMILADYLGAFGEQRYPCGLVLIGERVLAAPDVRHALVEVGFARLLLRLSRLRLDGGCQTEHTGDRRKPSEQSPHRFLPPLMCNQLAADHRGGNAAPVDLAFPYNRIADLGPNSAARPRRAQPRKRANSSSGARSVQPGWAPLFLRGASGSSFCSP